MAINDQAGEQSVEERMMAYLEKEEAGEEPAEPEQDEEPQVEEEAEDGEDSEPEQPAIVKLKVNGEEIEKPITEVVELAQKGIDYTQKTQQLADERRQVENYAQTVQANEQRFQQQVQLQQALIQDIAAITAIDGQLSQYQQLNWNALSDQDPVEAQKAFFQYNQLQTQRAQAVQGLEQKQNYITQSEQQRLQQMIAEGQATLQREIPNWGRETAVAIKDLGVSLGFTAEEMAQVIDPRQVKVLYRLQQAEAELAKFKNDPSYQKKVSNAPPVVKPGSSDQKVVKNSQNKQIRDELRRTGNGELAQKLIERML